MKIKEQLFQVEYDEADMVFAKFHDIQYSTYLNYGYLSDNGEH